MVKEFMNGLKYGDKVTIADTFTGEDVEGTVQADNREGTGRVYVAHTVPGRIRGRETVVLAFSAKTGKARNGSFIRIEQA